MSPSVFQTGEQSVELQILQSSEITFRFGSQPIISLSREYFVQSECGRPEVGWISQ